MKIMHLADVHLGSKMASRYPKDITEFMRQQLRATFLRAINFAQQNDVKVVMLCGDIFDSDDPFKKDKEFFYGAIKNAKNIDFLYLKGNHDLNGDDALSAGVENLKTFSDSWQSYRYKNTVISGVELSNDNCESIYSTLRLDPENYNIVMLHGQVSDASGPQNVNLKRLKNLNVNYLALGHIHKPSFGALDERGEYAYCGCLCGRGFDEIGERGFILLDDEKRSREFVPFAQCVIHEETVDISDVAGSFDAYRRIKQSVRLKKSDIYRINLKGEVDAEIDLNCDDISAYLKDDCAFSDVKDLTELKLELGELEKDRSLKGEFARLVLKDDKLDDNEKKKIISLGLRALDGGDLDI